MGIKVLAVGPSDIENLVLDVAREYPEIEMNYVVYNTEMEILNLIKQHQYKSEILLFAGSLPYNIAKEHLNVDKPMVYVQFKGTALYRVLFNLIRETNHDFSYESLNISIDNLEKAEVEECLEDLEVNFQNILFYENNLEKDIDCIINYHYDLWKKNQINVAITSIGAVYERLIELGVPASRIIPTRSSVRNSIQRVLLEGKSLRQLESQIAIGIIDLNDIYQNNISLLSEYQIQRRILALQNILNDYGEKSQSLIEWSDKKEVRFITTRGSMPFNDSNSMEIDLLNEIFSKTKIRASLGIGIGRTANEAGINAQEALKKARTNKFSCFLVDIDGTVHGPIGDKLQLSYSVRSDDPKLINTAKQADLSSSTINRLVSFCEVHGRNTVTTYELANGLGITSRSARRILAKLEKADLAVVTGEEQPVNRGRPRQVYTLLLHQEETKSINKNFI